VAKTPPPAAPVSFLRQQQEIQANGGRPPAISQMRQSRVGNDEQPRSNIRMAPPVTAGTPQNGRDNPRPGEQQYNSGNRAGQQQRNDQNNSNSSLLPTTTPANHGATCRIIRTGRRLLAMRDSRTPMYEIIRTGHRLPITSANRRVTRRIIRTGRRLLAMQDSRSPMGGIIRIGPRLPITPAKRRAMGGIIRTGRPLPTPVGSYPKAINPGIRPKQCSRQVL